MSFVILFPDFKAANGRSAFGTSLKRLYPQAHIVPVLNGINLDELQRVAQEISTDYEPVVSEGEGVVAVLRDGYRYVLQYYPDLPVVRLDTDEHPIEKIPDLLACAEKARGMCVGDLEFSDTTLRSGSVDEFINLNLFPHLFRHFTGGKLELSGAYGFQAFAAGALKTIFEAAEKIIKEAAAEANHPLKWGFEAAMILGALSQNVPVVIEKIPAESLRDRPTLKISQQIADTLAVFCAANRLFHLNDATPH